MNRKITDEKEIRELLGIESTVLSMSGSIKSGEIDEDNNTVSLSFSSETEAIREFGIEILDHNPESVDLSRLQNGAAVLVDHVGDQVGVVENAEIANKKGLSKLRFSRNPRGQEVFNDIVDDIRRNVSVGYQIHEITPDGERDGMPVFRVTRWQPTEISIVGVPLDVAVGVGRSLDTKEDNKNDIEPIQEDEPKQTINIIKEERKMEDDNKEIDLEKVKREARKESTREIGEMYAAGNAGGLEQDEVRKLIGEGASLSDVQARAIENLKHSNEKIDAVQSRDLLEDVKPKEKEAYSFERVLKAIASGEKADGIEGELSRELQLKSGMASTGTRVPFFALTEQRTLVAGSGGGAELVPDDHRGDMFIEFLRNRVKTAALGARIISGLSGNVSIPRQTATVTPASLAETGAITPADSNYDTVALTPNRVGAASIYSKQLLIQSNPSIAALVRDDLMSAMGIKIDDLALNGTGASNEPTGIFATSGVNTVTFGVGSPTWAKVVEFETAVATDNADVSNMAYLTTAGVRGAWKTEEKASSTGIYLWQENSSPVNGYRAEVSQQFNDGTNNDKVIFGDWSQLIIANFGGGIDLEEDTISGILSGTIQIVANTFIDIAVRHPVSFAISTDAGNQ